MWSRTRGAAEGRSEKGIKLDKSDKISR